MRTQTTIVNISLWKRIISHFFEVELERRSSAYNTDLIVILYRGRLQLCTPNAVYSYEERYYNFAEVFSKHLDLGQVRKGSALILGLGMGSIPLILDRANPGIWNFTAVEIDEVVCQLATEYCFPKITAPIQTIITDAVNYVAGTQGAYDLICVDLFIDDRIPDRAMSKEFLLNLKNLLAKNGTVVYNTLAFTSLDREQSRSFFDSHFSEVFKGSRIIHAHKNYMLVS